MTRPSNSLRGIRPGGGEPGAEAPAREDVIRWVLSVWADQGRRTGLPVRGTSMWPFLRSGERVVVRHGGAQPRVGEVVVALQGPRTIAHRVIEIKSHAAAFEVRTKGDFTLVADPEWFGPDRLVGVIEGVEGPNGVSRRASLQGIAGYCLARLSRLQGALCRPLQAIRRRDRGGRAGPASR